MACDFLRTATLRFNVLTGAVLKDDWTTSRGRWQSLVASEVVYAGYGPLHLAAFIARAWTGDGPCLVANGGEAVTDGGSPFKLFESGLRQFGLSWESRVISCQHADGRNVNVGLWEIHR